MPQGCLFLPSHLPTWLCCSILIPFALMPFLCQSLKCRSGRACTWQELAGLLDASCSISHPSHIPCSPPAPNSAAKEALLVQLPNHESYCCILLLWIHLIQTSPIFLNFMSKCLFDVFLSFFFFLIEILCSVIL